MNVIGLYDKPGTARKVKDALIEAGVSRDGETEILAGKAADGLAEQLTGWGVSRHDARLYAEAVRHGKAVVRAVTDDDDVDEALSLMEEHGARPLAEVEEELRRAGSKEGEEEEEEAVLQVAEEKLTVGKTERQGVVRARREVTQKPVSRTVELREERVEIEREPVERELSPKEAKEAFREETIELTETREVPEISKQARVVEEVRLRKAVQVHEERIRGSVRRSDVRIEREEK